MSGAVDVRQMSVGDLPTAAMVIGRAFADNPSTLANVDGDHAKAERFMRRVAQVVKLETRYSYVLVAEVDGELVGVLNAVQSPHCQMRVIDRVKIAPTMIRTLGRALPRVMRMTAARARHDPSEAHWHVGPIGVDPTSQGRGAGSALLASFLATVDEQRAAAFLETDVDRNVTLYERFGFAVTTCVDILGVNTRFMWRGARTT